MEAEFAMIDLTFLLSFLFIRIAHEAEEHWIWKYIWFALKNPTGVMDYSSVEFIGLGKVPITRMAYSRIAFDIIYW